MVLIPLITYILKTACYAFAIKKRRIEAPLKISSLIAGASFLAGWLPFPPLFSFFLTVAIASIVLNQKTDVDFYPDGILIPLAVEAFTFVIIEYGVTPLLS